mmetsp:Transcript_1965/g.4343  ORF Transcript_1965/g.4343 Transcript_1965/m.4343 type:complete len:252 (-) Transcript_1965:1026-1781(-)
MEAVVLQPFGDVLLDDPRLPPNVRAIDDELMGALVIRVGRTDLVVWRQPGLHVIRVEDGVPRGVSDAFHAKHRAEHPRNASDACLTPRSRRDCTQVSSRGWRDHGVVGQVRCEVLTDTDGAKAWTAATMGNAEGLVEVQVAHIRANHARGREAKLGIHICPIHVDLAAIFMHDLADLLDVVFKKGSGGGIGHHQGSEGVLVLLAHLLEFLQVHAFRIINPLDLHVAHGCRGRVCAVGRPWDDANVPLPLAK